MLVTQSCPTLCDRMDYSPPGFSVHGILQARILEWIAMPFSRWSSRPRDQTQVPALRADSLLLATRGSQLWSILKCKWTRRKTRSLFDKDLLSVFYISGTELKSGDLKIVVCCLRW